ncbi:hypothetical protein D3C80_1767920 [compost metagenome]
MHQIDSLRTAFDIDFARQETPGMAIAPHQPRQTQNIHRGVRQFMQPTLQLCQHQPGR